ncbi:ATP-binding protein [Streptomyces sp. NPDC020379]|uniref:ATP-binding protein n=1 Tax=Streptomyces sp. NPDC020379 TaxID=3365071 RepID=UPI003799B195
MSKDRQAFARYLKATYAVKPARHLAGKLAAEWGLENLAHDLVLVVSELVTNAVIHGTGRQILVTYSLTCSRLRIEVRDTGTWNPAVMRRKLARARQGGLRSHGRGLMLVEAISSRWGCSRRVVGKAVWCEIDIPVEPERRAA